VESSLGDPHLFPILLPLVRGTTQIISIHSDTMGKRLGAFRATYLVVLSCIGSFLFAYDTGIVGGVLTLASFQRDMGFTAVNKTQISSNSASLLQAGGETIVSLICVFTNIQNSFLCVLSCVALYCSVWTSLVHRSGFSCVRSRRHTPAFLSWKLRRVLVCWSNNIRFRCRYRDNHHPDVLC
jgi:hypothetical protein